MSRESPVKPLNAEVARKIAAGEVIDRPCSIVRELMDNAIDSKADSITVEITGGGIEKIRVVDNGCGMTKEDLISAARPHSTSKIRSETDLLKLSTLGFRGEALASIAAVSRLSITSGGWKMKASITEDHVIEKTPEFEGTIVQSEGLFENIPARRVFLKREATEGILCKNMFVEKCIPQHEKAFRLIINGEVKMNLPKNQSLKERFLEASEIKENSTLFYQVDGKSSDKKDDWSFSVIIGEPGIRRPNKKDIQIFLNGRKIQDYALVQAIEYGCKGYFPNGTFPVAAAFIQIDSSLVDFNIHPAKKEVKFKDIAGLHHGLSSTLAAFWQKYTNRTMKASFLGSEKTGTPDNGAKNTSYGSSSTSSGLQTSSAIQNSSGTSAISGLKTTSGLSIKSGSDFLPEVFSTRSSYSEPSELWKRTAFSRSVSFSSPSNNAASVSSNKAVSDSHNLSSTESSFSSATAAVPGTAAERTSYIKEKMDEIIGLYNSGSSEPEEKAAELSSSTRNSISEKPAQENTRQTETTAGKNYADSSVNSKTAENPVSLSGEEYKKSASNAPEADTFQADAPQAETPDFHSFHLLGSALGTFIIAEYQNALYIIDKHAAHERMIFDRIMNEKSTEQQLLIPYVIETKDEAEDKYLESILGELKKAGFTAHKKSEGTWEFTTLNERWKGSEEDLEHALFDKKVAPKDLLYSIAAMTACKAAVKDGWTLADSTAEEIAKGALCLKDPHCPHGRPCYFTLTREELFKWVRRTE